MSWLSKKFGVPVTPVEKFLSTPICPEGNLSLTYETFLISYMPRRLQNSIALMDRMLDTSNRHTRSGEEKSPDMEAMQNERMLAKDTLAALAEMKTIIRALKKARSLNDFMQEGEDIFSLPAGHIAQSGGKPEKLNRMAVISPDALALLHQWAREHLDKKEKILLADTSGENPVAAVSFAEMRLLQQQLAGMRADYGRMIAELEQAPRTWKENKMEAWRDLSDPSRSARRIRGKAESFIEAKTREDRGGHAF